MVLVHVHHFPNKQNHTRNPPKRNQLSTRNPPKRNQSPTRNLPKRNRRGGACVPARTSAQRRFHAKNTRTVCGVLNDGCALVGRRGRAHRHRPYHPTNFHQTMQCSITSPHCTFDSARQSHGVPLPHRGYTFDSAGLASATQPTLGNNASEEATPLGVVLFLITYHHHMRRMDYSRMISPHEN